MISALGNLTTRLDTSRIDPASSMMTSSATETAGTSAQGFAAAMADVAKEATQTLKSAETTSIQGINGQASTQAVVDAVMGAERTLQTAIAIRDKVVSAYLELSRMSI